MGEHLKQRLHQQKFSSVYQEAFLSILVAAEELNGLMDVTCEQHGITIQQYNVLRILRGAHPGGHPRCNITDRMVQRAPDVTRLINRLVVQGYATRGRSDDDGRLSLTFITRKGLELLEVIQPAMDQMEKDYSAFITQSQAKQLAQICDKLIHP